MGLISAAVSSAKGVVSDQWKEFFYCDAMSADILVARGKKRNAAGNNGSDNIISNGSVIAVADGQCMLITEQGKVVDLCAEPGEYIYDMSSEPSVFTGSLPDSVQLIFRQIGKRFTFGGSAAKDQRVYFFNTKEIYGNKYGTPHAVPFRVVDKNAGIDIDIGIRCYGEYSYALRNPILFYTNVCGNVKDVYRRGELDSQLKSELLTALQPAFARISELGIRYSALPGHTTELADALNEELSAKWKNLRGIEVVSAGITSLNASDEDEKMLKELQRNAAFRDPTMAAAHLVGAQASAMQTAAGNAAGAATGFYGMNMAAQTGGFNASTLYGVAAQQNAASTAAAQSGTQQNVWYCTECGSANQGKFCSNCGTKKPAGALQYRCDKCGWQPADPTHPPKFCPECGDPFNDSDIVS